VSLLLIPFLPPVKGSRTYERLAYWVSISSIWPRHLESIRFSSGPPCWRYAHLACWCKLLVCLGCLAS
jgi:hypothetical protein